MIRSALLGLLGVLAASPVLAETPPAAPLPPAAPAAPLPPAAPAASPAPLPPAAPTTHVAQVSQQVLVEMQASDAGTVVVLDVRTPAEFAAGHVPGAVNIPYDQVASRLGEIPKGDEIVLYCHSGRRAGLAAEVLTANGYQKLAHLEGDMPGWQQAGRPVETATAPTN